MSIKIRRIFSWSILLLLMVAGAAACQKRFSITEYQMNILSVRPGAWVDGEITRYPSVDVRIDGPDTQDWEITVSPANGASPYSESAETGRIKTILLEGIELSKERREMGITIRAIHVNTGEVLAINSQYKASIEGNFDPVVPPTPTPQETLSITGLSLVMGEESTPITIAEGHRATLDILENCSGTLMLAYSQEESETNPVSCTLSQTEGKNHITLSQEGIVKGESTFTIPFTTAEPGTGSFSLTLKGNGPETVLTVSYIIKSRPYEATFEPNHFTFAEGNDAHGKVEIFGFAEGEKCDVVLRWKETTSGDEGSTAYPGIDVKEPLDVILWKAGEAAIGKNYIFWAEIYEQGKTEEPVAVTEKKTVTPFAISLSWTDAQGEPVLDGKIRSWYNRYKRTLSVTTASWAPEFINKVSVKDVTAGRSYSSQTPASEADGSYTIEMTKYPERGVHKFTVTLQTTEGDYSFETEMTFIDVWTFVPYKKGSSLYAEFRGPTKTSVTQTDCSLTVLFNVYAAWNYTVAEVNSEGKRVNTPKLHTVYVRNKGVDYTVPKGTKTTNGSDDIKFKEVAGLFNVALSLLKPMGRGRSFSETGLTASRWDGGSIVNYTPPESQTMVSFSVKVSDVFTSDYNEVMADVSKLIPILQDEGILYLP